MFPALDVLIRLILFTCAIVGAVMLFQGAWSGVYRGFRRAYYGANQRRMLRVSRGFGTQQSKASESYIFSSITVHLENVLHATLKGKLQTVSNFLLFSSSVAGVSFILFFVLIHRVGDALLPALLALFAPYLVLLVRRYHVGINNSYEIVESINILIPAYRREHKSMIHALSSTVEKLPPGPIRRAYGRLVDRLSDYETPEEARLALRRFVAQLGTTWAIQMANDIEHAIMDGVDVEYSLVAMHTEMQEIQDALKDQKLDRADSLLVAIVPFFFWPALMQFFYMRISHNIYYYQFDNPEGFRWFLITVVCTVGSFIIGLIFYKPKQDV
ncbi:hypothetical protein NZD89_28000 (plasmid) [Alicyclobacillus fastidiosus]|uniref:Type II secretion system protein GspF domain-containing protein n=1 Tax=Alicyclobacillus fastidiosus TaxID=392011 RepID=A0ABY6ZPI7_9BACL|nr:hypothetical protein [Alicyclobacillus fastidiosus]WAH44893.1 hypothetical protein NZD89_28000 [Alicyclobacillus fastidiosus]GMA65652.1 hypothetical protein GCM10025859_60920 [Alicyclobacillus fastidiosus]